MSYEEFWEKDYLLVESYVKKHEMDVDGETDSNWELVSYIRGAMLEIVTSLYGDKKNGKKPFEFPSKPSYRTKSGNLRDERNKSIASEIKLFFEAKMRRRKAESDDND